jgi:hypothetical protein
MEFGNDGARRVISAAGETGAAGMASRGLTTVFDQATTFGIAMSFFSLTLGAVTMVWERLSASGGTEMTAWRAGAGSASSGGSVEALRVSRGGRYSDGW